MLMKTAKMFLKKLRKGMTLLELVIAIALTSIIFAGAGTALFLVNKVSRQETKNNVTLLDAKNLYQVIDLTIKKDRGDVTYLDLGDDNTEDNVGKIGCQLLFTIKEGDNFIDYGFDKTTFGIIEGEKIEGENIKYKSEYAMYFSVKKQLDGKYIEFVIHYGDNYASSLSLIERI